MTPTLDALDQRDLLEPAQRIAKAHGLTVEAMFTDRALPAPMARAEFYAILHGEMGWSEAAIGRLVGKDHTTIGNALRRRGGKDGLTA